MPKPLTALVALLMLPVSFQAAAWENIVEPHAMVYFRLSFDGGTAPDRQSTFGLRLDQVRHSRNSHIEYASLMRRPAMLNLELNRNGIRSLYISGTDYLRLYRLHRADEENGEEPAAQAGDDETAMQGEEDGEQPPRYPQVGKDIGDTMKTVMDKAPAGVIIGVGLGIALLAGVGG